MYRDFGSRIFRRGPRPTLKMQEVNAKIKKAKRDLSKVEKGREQELKALRRKLSNAERAYGRAERMAQASLAQQKKVREQGIAEAKKRYESICKTLAPMEVDRFKKAVLYEDRIVTKQGEEPLQPGVTAVADTAARIAISRPIAVAELSASGVIDGRAFRSARGYEARRFYVLIEGQSMTALLPCRPNEEQKAKDFAARINVAALNALRVARERKETLEKARREMEDSELYGEGLLAAEDDLRRVIGDTAEVDHARAQFEEVNSNKKLINAQYERVAELTAQRERFLAEHQEHSVGKQMNKERQRASSEQNATGVFGTADGFEEKINEDSSSDFEDKG